MSYFQFIKSFLIFLASLCIVLFFIHRNVKYADFIDLSVFGVCTYALLTIGAYRLASYFSAKSKDMGYIQLIYLNFLLKLIITIAIPTFYFLIKKPQGMFVLPFLIIYIAFTIYETWMLHKMAVMR